MTRECWVWLTLDNKNTTTLFSVHLSVQNSGSFTKLHVWYVLENSLPVTRQAHLKLPKKTSWSDLRIFLTKIILEVEWSPIRAHALTLIEPEPRKWASKASGSFKSYQAYFKHCNETQASRAFQIYAQEPLFFAFVWPEPNILNLWASSLNEFHL